MGEGASGEPTGWLRLMARLSGWQATVCMMLVGAFGVLALPPFSVVPFYALSLSLLLLRAHAIMNRGWKTVAFEFWCFGFGFFVAGLYWIGNSFLVDAETFAWLLPIAAVLMPSGLALFFALAGAVLFLVYRRAPAGTKVFFLLTMVILIWSVEWLRGHILTGFPWNLPGYIWADDLEVAQAARWTGIYGLSFLTLIWAVSPGAGMLLGWKSKAGMASLTLFVALPLVGYWDGDRHLKAHPTQFDQNVVLRLVQPNVPQAEKWLPETRVPNFQRLLDQTASGGFKNVTHVLWPETATPFLLDREPDAQAMISAALGDKPILITGFPRIEFTPERNLFFNAVGSLTKKGGLKHEYDKRHLVPFGEYLPMAEILGAIGLKKLTAGREGYSTGQGPVLFDVPGLPGIRPLICYEIIFPGEVASKDGRSASLLLNLTNDAWFGDSTGPYQHLAISRMRAIENGVPVIRVANTGISAVIDPAGRILQRIGLNDSGVIDTALPLPIR